MIITSLDSLIIQSLIFAVINTTVSKKINNQWLTASTGFWFGWIVLLFSTRSFIHADFMNNLEVLSIKYISIFHWAAFTGFFLASIYGSFFRDKSRIKKKELLQKLRVESTNVSEYFGNKFLNILVILGLIFFVQRVLTVGLDINYFTNVRDVYNERSFSLLNWLGTHLSVIVYILLFVQGISDAFNKMNIKKVFKTIVYASPLFLASGSRTFLIFPLIYYFSSLLLTRVSIKNSLRFLTLKEFRDFSFILIMMSFIFSIIGFIRGGYGNSFSLYYLIIAWPVSTTIGLESWLEVAISSQSTNGFLSLDWIANIFQRLGILDYTQEKNMLENIDYQFLLNGDSARVVPRSMIPDLIFDFGTKYLYLISTIFFFIIQFITINFSGKSLTKQIIAAMLIVAMFMTIQMSVFSPGFMVSLFWLFLYKLFNKGSFNLNFYKKTN